MELASKARSTITTPSETASFTWPWLLGFVLIVYLGLSGGGFDPLVSSPVGIIAWWILLLGVLVGALPRRRPGVAALCVLGLLISFAVWTALSLDWTESVEKTATDVARVVTLLGVFGLALLTRDRAGAAQMVSALGTGIAVVALVAVLSRLHPSWFPEADETGRFLETGRERLSYPLDYWNGLAALIGIGLPLILQIANGAKLVAVRALAAAAAPMMLLALFFTLSRGGIAAALVALALFLALTVNRIPQSLTMAIAGLFGGFLVFLALQRHDLVHGLDSAAGRSEGNGLLWLMIVSCAAAALAQAALAYAMRDERRPRWTKISRRSTLIATAAALVVVVVGLAAFDAPGRISTAWSDFKRPSGHSEEGTSRLVSTGGENRYQLWSSAVREFNQDPLTGTGSGTFQLWWTRDGKAAEPIVDTHSLYLQTLGELGLAGLVLLLAFVLTSLWVGGKRLLTAGPSRRPQLAAALAASTVLWTTSLFDWMWKIPIVPIAALLLIAVTITAGDASTEGQAALPWSARLGVVAASVAALVAIAIPFASTSLVRQSQVDATKGNLDAALKAARDAQNVEPGAATPRIQQALLLESRGDYAAAEEAALAATERETTNWKTWLILSRIEAQRGHVDAALRDFRRARALNPRSPLFAER